MYRFLQYSRVDTQSNGFSSLTAVNVVGSYYRTAPKMRCLIIVVRTTRLTS
jgi:hypothetical protein